jgi:histone H3/H4
MWFPTLENEVNGETELGAYWEAEPSATRVHAFTRGPAKTFPYRRELAPGPNRGNADQTRRSQPIPSPPAIPCPMLAEQDRLLPMANVARIMAEQLPRDAKISRDAKVMMQEFASEFLCFITSEAHDLMCKDGSGSKAIAPCHVVEACSNLGKMRCCCRPPPPPPPRHPGPIPMPGTLLVDRRFARTDRQHSRFRVYGTCDGSCHGSHYEGLR